MEMQKKNLSNKSIQIEPSRINTQIQESMKIELNNQEESNELRRKITLGFS